MNRFRKPPTPFRSQPQQHHRRNESLSEKRYSDLLKSARDFFASAVVSTDGERQAAIDEINERMVQYGLTVEDLR
jgi:hypothetical protein